MDWMSNLFVVLFITSITGTIFYVIGMAFSRIWFRDDVRLLRIQMRIAQWAFIIPFVYIILYVRARGGVLIADGSINLFYTTSVMQRIYAILGCVWTGLFLALLVYKLYVRFRWMWVFRGNIPEEDAGTEKLFREICARLGVEEGKVSLYRNDSVEMPCITYSHGFAVVLPLKCYTEKETAVILYHELCHYLSGDIYLKTASCIAALLHVLNPVAHIMLRQLSLICEECCDRMACEKGAGMFSRKEYFLTILSALAEEDKRERYNLFLLADTIGDYERRVQSMRKYRADGGLKKGTAVLLTACFLLGSSITALAAGDGMTVAYGAAAEATADRVEEDGNAAENMAVSDTMSDEEILEEFARAYDLDPEDVVMIGEEDIETIGNFMNVEGDIDPGKTLMTSGFSKEVGDVVTVTTVGSPSDQRYQMGIKDPNALMRYVEGTGTMVHDFEIKIKGRHYFFVTNLNSSSKLHIKATVMK